MGTASKIFTVIGFIALALILGIVGLGFLNTIAKKDSDENPVDTDPDLGEQFEDDYENYSEDEDFGEKEALRQQEALLREMMGSSTPPGGATAQDSGGLTATAPPPPPPQLESKPTVQLPPTEEDKSQEVEFESLLNSFQSVANKKPDLLAKKIEVWLDEND